MHLETLPARQLHFQPRMQRHCYAAYALFDVCRACWGCLTSVLCISLCQTSCICNISCAHVCIDTHIYIAVVCCAIAWSLCCSEVQANLLTQQLLSQLIISAAQACLTYNTGSYCEDPQAVQQNPSRGLGQTHRLHACFRLSLRSLV